MTTGSQHQGEACARYADMVELDRPASARPPMPLADRAAQFSPFAALSGHEDAVQEAGRFVEERVTLGDAERAELDRKLSEIRKELARRPHVIVTCFVSDEFKEGGTYATREGRVRAFDEEMRALVFESGERILIADIFSLTCI